MTSRDSISPSITFEGAIAETQVLLEQMEVQQLSGSELVEQVKALVASENGVRGFFVTYLTDERSLFDQNHPEIVEAFQSSPTIVAEFLVKNLAMSSGMALYHHRQNDDENAQGSERVQRRTASLIAQVQLPDVTAKAIALIETLKTGTGDYQAFLDRWGYDADQRQAILAAFSALALTAD